MASSATELLWQAYRRAEVSAKSALIEHYLPLVQRICGRLSINLPPHVDREDLESAGVLGLMDAIANFDPGRGVKFETYAANRIRGAAIDGLRQMDFVPRSVRQKANMLQNTLQQLGTMLGRTPQEAEIAAALEIDVQTLSKWWQDIRASSVISLNIPIDRDDESGVDLAATLPSTAVDPLDKLLDKERVEELALAVSQLNDREKLLLSLYYEQKLTLKELGLVLGISESRSSQIHTAAIAKLRARLS